MKNIHSQLIERFIREMEYRNYSPRSIQSYSSLLSKVESYYNQPLDKITGGQFKEYLHGRITADKISVTMVNQYIIIAQTAFAISSDSEKVKEAGCNDYLPKPINKEHLFELIQKYFRQ